MTRPRLRFLWAGLILLAPASACRPAPELVRVRDVRPVHAEPGAPQPGRILTMEPAATPTFPTLVLHDPGALDRNLSRGWSRGSTPGFNRGADVRFWVGTPRPLRLRLRVRLEREPSAPTDVLVVGVRAHEVGRVELSEEGSEAVFSISADILRPGSNMMFFSRMPRKRRGVGRVTFDELVIEDAESPTLRPAVPVEVVLEGEAPPAPGLQVNGDGPLAYLVHLPGAPQELDLGIACEEGSSPDPPRFAVTVESDQGSGEILRGEAPFGQLLRHRASLEDFAGVPIRLSLSLAGLSGPASCVWVEPRLQPLAPGPDTDGTHELRSPRANIIVVILDAAARDRFSLYGSRTSTTPFFEQLAPESLVFDRAVAQASYTVASTASLFTGLLPPTHGVTVSLAQHRRPLSASVATYAEVLAATGYSTTMFTGNPNSVNHKLGRGFQEVHPLYQTGGGARRLGVTLATDFEAPIRQWVAAPRTRPFFLYVHSVQPHEPYDVAPEEFYRDLIPGYDGLLDGTIHNIRRHTKSKKKASAEDLQHLLALYEGNLRYADAVLEDLIEILRESGLLESSILVVTSDHGESLGERGRFGHGNNIHRETTSIPLLIRFPARFGVTGRVSLPFGTVDIMPTVLDFADVSGPAGTWGRSQLPVLAGPSPTEWPRPLPSWAGGSNAASVAVFGADCKYTFDNRDGRESLFTFEEQEDGEDIRSQRPVTFDYLAFTSLTAGTPLVGDTSASEPEEVDADTLEALRALGYVE